MRHVTKLRNVIKSLFLWDREVVAGDAEATEIDDVVSDDGEATEIVNVVAGGGEATEIAHVVAGDSFFLLNISASFPECLAAHFKLFLPIVYVYDVHTTTLVVTAKCFIWSFEQQCMESKETTERKGKKKVTIISVWHTKNEWLSRAFKIKQWMLRWLEKRRISNIYEYLIFHVN